MIGDLSVLAVVPARGGSKGLPRKNILPINGRPLLAWTADAALRSSYIDRLVLSTDDEEIMAVGRRYGLEVPFVRPPELAGDQSSSVDVVLHASAQLGEFDLLVLLQPTSPLRTTADIDTCIEHTALRSAAGCVSVVEPKLSPYWMLRMEPDGRIVPLFSEEQLSKRRQDLPRAYAPNGAVYVVRRKWFEKVRGFFGPGVLGYVMPPERSLDIDTWLDLQLFQLLLGPDKEGEFDPDERKE